MKKRNYVLLVFLYFNVTFLFAQKPELIIPTGNPAEVITMAYSTDGKYIASGGYDCRIKLWDAKTGKELKTYSVHADTGHITTLLFTPDSNHIISSGRDAKIVCFNINSGKPDYSLTGHTQCITSIKLTNNGRYLLSGSWDGTAKLWDLNNIKCIKTFHNKSSLNCVGFSKDENTIFLSGKEDSCISVWNINDTLHPLALIHFNYKNSGIFIIHDSMMLTGSRESNLVYLLNLNKLQKLIAKYASENKTDFTANDILIRKFLEYGGSWCFDFSKDGSKFIVGSGRKNSDDNIYVWSLDKKNQNTPVKLEGHTGEVHAVCFSPDGKEILSGSYDKTMILWNNQSYMKLITFKGHTGIVNNISWSDDNKYILSCFKDSFTPKLFKIENNNIVNLTGHTDTINGLKFSPDNNHFITSSNNDYTKLWRIDSINFDKNTSSKSTNLFIINAQNKISYILSKKGDSILYCDTNNFISVWDFKTNNILKGRRFKTKYKDIDFSYDLEYVVITGDTKNKSSLSVFKNDSVCKILMASGKNILNLMLTNDKKYIISLSSTNVADTSKPVSAFKIDIWKIGTFEKINLTLCDSLISYFRYFPGNELLLTSRLKGGIDLWDIKSRKNISAFLGLKSEINSIFISNDKKIILTGSNDGRIVFHDFTTQKELATLTLLDSADWVVTTPEGRFDASAGAMKKMYYVVGLVPIGLTQIEHRYYQPNLLKTILGYNNEPLFKITAFDSVRLFPDCHLKLKKDTLSIDLRAQGGGIGKVSVFIDNIEIIPDARENPLSDASKTKLTILIDLDNYKNIFNYDSINTIKVICTNNEGYLTSPGDTVHFTPISAVKTATGKNTGSHAEPKTISLYSIVVGTSHYSSRAMNLTYADKDAIDFAHALKMAGSCYFGSSNTHIELMTTDSTTTFSSKENIKKEFYQLSKKTNPDDVVVIYFSGHGISSNGQTGDFYYLTTEANASVSNFLYDTSYIKAVSVSGTEIIGWLNRLSARKKILIFDACASGKAAEKITYASRDLPASQIRSMEELKNRSGLYVLAGSEGSMKSLENPSFKQGLLTYSLLKAMRGDALENVGGMHFVNIETLFKYAIKNVPLLAKGLGDVQQPVWRSPDDIKSFDIGCVTSDKSDSIVLIELPIITNVNFREVNKMYDSLNITKSINDYLSEQSDSPSSKVGYTTFSEYPDAIFLTGDYSITGEQIELKFLIIKNSKPIGGIYNINGVRSNITELSKKMVDLVLSVTEKTK